MKKISKALKEQSKLSKFLFLSYIVFAGCFVFPFSNALFPFGLTQAYLVISSYGITGLGLAMILGRKQYHFVYLATFFLTALGMVFRYFLEYGEFSNTLNFTTFNIVSYLALVPLLVLGAYHFFLSTMMKAS